MNVENAIAPASHPDRWPRLRAAGSGLWSAIECASTLWRLPLASSPSPYSPPSPRRKRSSWLRAEQEACLGRLAELEARGERADGDYASVFSFSSDGEELSSIDDEDEEDEEGEFVSRSATPDSLTERSVDDDMKAFKAIPRRASQAVSGRRSSQASTSTTATTATTTTTEGEAPETNGDDTDPPRSLSEPNVQPPRLQEQTPSASRRPSAWFTRRKKAPVVQTAALFRLPAEVRVQIWAYVYAGETLHIPLADEHKRAAHYVCGEARGGVLQRLDPDAVADAIVDGQGQAADRRVKWKIVECGCYKVGAVPVAGQQQQQQQQQPAATEENGEADEDGDAASTATGPAKASIYEPVKRSWRRKASLVERKRIGGLHRTCRIIYLECIDLLYSIPAFSIPSQLSLLNFAQRVPPRSLQQIRRLHFYPIFDISGFNTLAIQWWAKACRLLSADMPQLREAAVVIRLVGDPQGGELFRFTCAQRMLELHLAVGARLERAWVALSIQTREEHGTLREYWDKLERVTEGRWELCTWEPVDGEA